MKTPTLFHQKTNERSRPAWIRALTLLVVWLMALQPAISSAQLVQAPMFAAVPEPPNVMLMIDDSGSMNRLTLKPQQDFANPSASAIYNGQAMVKLNTKGYFGVSGMKWYFDPGAPDGHWADNYWTFSFEDLKARSANFNPLAYNPAKQYLPWRNNPPFGTPFSPASIGGLSGEVNGAVGPYTQWDMRNLPTAVAPVDVRSRLSPEGHGVIASPISTRAWGSAPAGSVRYEGLPPDNLMGLGVTAPETVDLFEGTIRWTNPTCGVSGTYWDYAWYCPQGTPWQTEPPGTCNSTTYGGESVDGTCCTDLVTYPPDSYTRYTDYAYDWYGSPPAPTLPATIAGQTCISPPFDTTNRRGYSLTPDVPPCQYGTPEPYQCGEAICYYTPIINCPGEQQWGCEYEYYVPNYPPPTCNAQIKQVCGGSELPYCAEPGQVTPTSDAQYLDGYWPHARYVTYEGPAPTAADPQIAARLDFTNYRVVMIDRRFGWDGSGRPLTGNPNEVAKWRVRDSVTGLPVPLEARPDCPPTQVDAQGHYCTFAQEAQNYANWYTYHRSRLFAAVGIMADVLSDFNGIEQFMRLGYGRINYFPSSFDPWKTEDLTSTGRISATLPNVDGAGNDGGVVRGVRPFTVYNPPLTPNPDRAAVFNWLFTLNGRGATPSREALHAAGLYLKGSGTQGPWRDVPGAGGTELWCRRQFVVYPTDGETTWMNTPAGAQPLLESMNTTPLGGPGTALASLGTTGPNITGGFNRRTLAPRPDYQYEPTSEPQISGGSGMSQTGTLSDVLLYWWNRDMRPDLANGLDPITTQVANRAFWQHMSSYIVGYGLSATMNGDVAPAPLLPVRDKFDARNEIDWPAVDLVACRQLDDNAEDIAIPNPGCALAAGGGNRVNDVLRAALSSGGDFFLAQSTEALKSSLQEVFGRINTSPASGTSPALSSSSVSAGNVLLQSGFRPNIWDGFLHGYDQQAYAEYILGITSTEPPALWSINFADPGARNIWTSSASGSTVTFSEFRWPSLTTGQQGQLQSEDVVDYLRGVNTREIRFRASDPLARFRNRFSTILGDIVNSTPVYSRGTDFAYQFKPAATETVPELAPDPAYEQYRAYLVKKRNEAMRTPVAVFGSNGGMFHVINTRLTGAIPAGREIFAYVPRALYPVLRDLSEPAYDHRYYVDGPVIEGDVWNPAKPPGEQWRTIAIGTTGAGPAGTFAIDITSPSASMDDSNVLWDIVPAQHVDPKVNSDLGNVLHPGIIGAVKNRNTAPTPPAPGLQGRWVYITGNGYDSVSQKATLLIFDALDGTLIRAIDTPVEAGSNGLGGPTPVYDFNRNIIAVYAGDKRGRMWKFDLSGNKPSDWKVFNRIGTTDVPLFVATDSLGARQPITAAPRIMQHPIGGLYVVFGTGKFVEAPDLIDMQVQSVYVLWDKGQAEILKTDLQPIALQNLAWDHDNNPMTGDVADGTFRNLKGTDVALYDWTKEGFYVRLIAEGGPAEGERILAAPILDGGVMTLSSYAPTSASDRCLQGGSSHIYRFNATRLLSSGFLNVPTSVAKRIQPGFVGNAPPLYRAVPTTGSVDEMDSDAVKKMLNNPKYKSDSGVAKKQGTVGKCAQVGLTVTGDIAGIPTECAGLEATRAWRPMPPN